MKLYPSSIDHNDAIPYTMEEWEDLGFDQRSRASPLL